MKRAYAASKYAKPYERYCRETYPDEASQILKKAEAYYLDFLKDLPDLGENMMAKNMLDWFTILAFYEASGHRMDGEALLAIKRRAVGRLKFLGAFIDGNRLFSSRRLSHCEARQRAWVYGASALPLQDRSLSGRAHARAAHPHPDRSARRQLLRLLVRRRSKPCAGSV